MHACLQNGFAVSVGASCARQADIQTYRQTDAGEATSKSSDVRVVWMDHRITAGQPKAICKEEGMNMISEKKTIQQERLHGHFSWQQADDFDVSRSKKVY